MTEHSRKDEALSAGPGHQVDKDPPAPSTLPEERENPGMKEKGRAELGASPSPRQTRDIDVGHRLPDDQATKGNP
jgi:hypothetical protein